MHDRGTRKESREVSSSQVFAVRSSCGMAIVIALRDSHPRNARLGSETQLRSVRALVIS